ncbi:MAG: LexA family transcriptional regulator [Saprospiraceae bacterium]
MSKANKNIRHLRAFKGWSQGQLAAALEIPRARIGAYEEERCEPPIEVLIKISDIFHIAIDALVRCDLSTVNRDELIRVGDNRILFPVVVDREREDKIEVVTVKASAGYLGGYADPEFIGDMPRMSLPVRILGKCRAFPIKGDSMPPLRDGSYVVARYVDHFKDVKAGKTYIVLTQDEGIVYKRLYPKGNILELRSDNPIYKPYVVHRKDVLELWEFVCAMNMDDRRDEADPVAGIYEMLHHLKSDIAKISKT